VQYTPLQQHLDGGKSQIDRFIRGVAQFGQDALNFPHDIANTHLRLAGDVQQGNADPLIDMTTGGNGTPPSATAVVTPSVIPCGPGVVCPTVSVTPVVTPGAPILSSSGGNDESGDGSQASGSVGSGNDSQATNGEGGPFWSSTGSSTAVENAYGHWDKHMSEFPEYQNSVQYVQGAQEFVSDPPAGTLTKTRSNGDTLLYDPSTNTFAVKAINGAPRTMFRPQGGLSYWNKQ
jgi:pyocin large subunit-like protein